MGTFMQWVTEQAEAARQESEKKREAAMAERAAKAEHKAQEKAAREARRREEQARWAARQKARNESLIPIEDAIIKHNREHQDDLTLISRNRLKTLERNERWLREDLRNAQAELRRVRLSA